MAISDRQIIDWLLANPTASDALIASTMQSSGVSPAQLASATGTNVKDIEARFNPAVTAISQLSASQQAELAAQQKAAGEAAWARQQAENQRKFEEQQAAAKTEAEAQARAQAEAQADAQAKAQADAVKAQGIASLPAAKTPPTIASLTEAYNTLGPFYTTSDITEAGEEVHVQTRDLGGGFGAWHKPGDIIGYDGQGESAIPISAPDTLGGFQTGSPDKK